MHYIKETVKTSETVRVKVHGKWKVEHKTVRTVECVYVAPRSSGQGATSTTLTPVTQPSAGSPTPTTQPGNVTTTTTSTTTTTTIPAPQTLGTNMSSVTASKEDVTCGIAYCYELSVSINDIGWPSPKNPPADIGTLTFSWSGAAPAYDGSTSVPVEWNGGGIYESAVAGIPNGYTVSASFSGGSYTDAYWGQITLRSATS